MATSKGSSHCQSTKDDLQDDDLGSDHILTPPSKKPRLDIPVCLVYIVEKKISSGHLSHLKGIANKKGFSLATILRLADIDVTVIRLSMAGLQVQLYS